MPLNGAPMKKRDRNQEPLSNETLSNETLVKTDDFKTASASFKARNPDIFSLGGLSAAQREQKQMETLERQVGGAQESRESVERRSVSKPRIALIAHRRRLLDSANLVASFKELQDAICEWLGVPDDDRGIFWEYSQIKTAGREGVMIKIEM